MWYKDYDFNSPTSNQDAFDPSQVNAGMIYPLENFYDALHALDGFSPMTIIDLNLTPSDLQALEQLKMTNIVAVVEKQLKMGLDLDRDTAVWGDCIPKFPCGVHSKDSKDSKDLPSNSVYEFLKSIAPESSPELINQIGDLTTNIINKIGESLSGLEHYHGTFSMEAFMPMDSQTGWHTDTFCSNDNNEKIGPSFFFLATLKGDHTLYYTGTYDYEPNICLPVHNDNIPQKLLVDHKAYSTPLGFAPIHIAHEPNGAIHSWPNITKPRLLIRVALHSDNCNSD